MRMVSRLTAGALALSLAFAPRASLSAQQDPQGGFMNIGFVGIVDAGWSTESDVPSLQLGDHDPRSRGFTIPNAELTLDGSVDPFFQGFANVVYKLDEEGETVVELEEVYFLTSSLPGNLQVKGGQFFAEFGRQNQQHPHAWAFVDQPLVLARLLGPEGLRSQGVRASWLLPTAWYTEAMVALMNSAGETAFSFRSEESPDIHGGLPEEREVKGLGDLLIVPRLVTSLDLSDTQTIVVGASAALGPNNSGPDADTQVVGADVYWRWRSLSAFQGFPFFSLQGEALFRRYDAGARLSTEDPSLTLPDETLRDAGGYAEVLWGIQPRWVLGARGEVVRSEEASFEAETRTDRYRLSPGLTWYPSEFSKLRLQYNFDHREGIGNDHSLWMQMEFILGAHAAHVF
jgi:hypothetical protein